MNENEQENEKRKTLADIVELVRRAAQYYEGEADKSEGLLRETFKLSADNYREIADRIEAAWEREREELDKRISDLEAYAKLWTGRADELRLKCDELYSKAKPVGNAAAMREALETIHDKVNGLDEECGVDPVEIRDLARAALSAPARNCDLPKPEERYAEFCSRFASCSTCPHNRTLNELRCDGKWLLAPAAERKGE